MVIEICIIVKGIYFYLPLIIKSGICCGCRILCDGFIQGNIRFKQIEVSRVNTHRLLWYRVDFQVPISHTIDNSTPDFGNLSWLVTTIIIVIIITPLFPELYERFPSAVRSRTHLALVSGSHILDAIIKSSNATQCPSKCKYLLPAFMHDIARHQLNVSSSGHTN